jgi:hypothetical protein
MSEESKDGFGLDKAQRLLAKRLGKEGGKLSRPPGWNRRFLTSWQGLTRSFSSCELASRAASRHQRVDSRRRT